MVASLAALNLFSSFSADRRTQFFLLQLTRCGFSSAFVTVSVSAFKSISLLFRLEEGPQAISIFQPKRR